MTSENAQTLFIPKISRNEPEIIPAQKPPKSPSDNTRDEIITDKSAATISKRLMIKQNIANNELCCRIIEGDCRHEPIVRNICHVIHRITEHRT